ncbi:MAG: metal-dependent hydrolase [Candidatus Hodarchaeales archaeon]|jgi:membrane-bound metal-dependent hydrolase YbcI (DUF457 family)
MPDILTHLLLGIALVLILRFDSWEEGYLVVVGILINDIERPITLLAKMMGLSLLELTIPFHSILGTLFLSLVVASLFNLKEIEFRRRLLLIILGSVFHLLADMTLYPWEEKGVFLLYPLKIPFSFNLFWPGYIGYPFIGLAFCLIGFAIFYFYKIRKNVEKGF